MNSTARLAWCALRSLFALVVVTSPAACLSGAESVRGEVVNPLEEPPKVGDVHRFDSGNTMVAFSTGGQLDEIDADGELVWRLNLDLGGAVGYVLAVDSLYPSP